MPRRLVPLVNNEVYHIYNQGQDKRPTFTDHREYSRALTAISFYRYKTSIKLSTFLNLPPDESEIFISSQLNEMHKQVAILSFCLMPNHFHFLVKQLNNNGISRFAGNFQNSYTKYFNTKRERKGSLFLDQFKAVRIETDEQLIHTSRYIHLNPYSSYVVKTIKETLNYPWSSLREYVYPSISDISDKNLILSFFKNSNAFKDFVLDNASYQRELEKIKHLVFEKE